MDSTVSPRKLDPNPTDKVAAEPPATNPRKKRTLRYALLGAACVAAVAGGVYGYDWYVSGRFIESTDNAYLRADQVSMAPQVAGQVAEIYVNDNQEVVTGQPLVMIDPRRYEMAVREAEATVAARQADVAKSEADLKQQDLVIAQAQADLENAEANADLAQKELDRTSPLAARGVQTQQQVDEKQSTLNQAQSTIRLKKAVVDAARQQVSSLRAVVDHAHAQLAAAQESLSQAQMDLSETVVRSPINGRVGDKTVQLGQFAQAGTLLMTVVPVDQIYLVANYKETQIGDMRPGQPATIRVDAYPGLEIKGTVDSFSPGTGARFALLPPENATGNFTKIVQRVPVRIRLGADARNIPALVPGMSIEVSVDTNAPVPSRMASS
ncbi:HlyD family secretion protein [Inquilinus sp. OTU3971]|uniref:HlyD family secretion protein n=1 Tax=Inquilinus sp. OTU3971 TaxID=3043855 RepID=UPI00313CAC49